MTYRVGGRAGRPPGPVPYGKPAAREGVKCPQTEGLEHREAPEPLKGASHCFLIKWRLTKPQEMCVSLAALGSCQAPLHDFPQSPGR